MNTQPTTKCSECHKQIPVDVYDAMNVLYGSRQYRGDRLATLILRAFKRDDESKTNAERRRVAIGAIEDWLDCKLSALCDAVSHYELDKDSVWCEHCNTRMDESEMKIFQYLKQKEENRDGSIIVSEWEEMEILCVDCYADATTRPQDEERIT